MMKYIKYICLTFLSSFLITESKCEIKAVVFDIGGVLCKTDKKAFAKEIFGVKDICYLGAYSVYYLDFTIWKFQERVLNLMSEIEQQVPTEDGLILRHGQTQLPEIMCKWFRGELTGNQVNDIVQKYIQDQADQNLNKFKNKIEQEVLSKVVKTMFDENKLASHSKPIDGMVTILKELQNSKKDYKIFVLSNWSKLSFESLFNAEHNKPVFDYFKDKLEHVFVSGDKKVIKPSRVAYKNVLDYAKEKYNIDPSECLMIDDQPENIESAINYCGMQGVVFNNNFNNLRAELIRQGVLEQSQQSWISGLNYLWS